MTISPALNYTRAGTCVTCIVRGILNHCITKEVPHTYLLFAYDSIFWLLFIFEWEVVCPLCPLQNCETL